MTTCASRARSDICVQGLQETLAKAGAAKSELGEECQRLRNHIADLESRKRAPLYQKKQEEELKVPSLPGT